MVFVLNYWLDDRNNIQPVRNVTPAVPKRACLEVLWRTWFDLE